MKDYAKVNQFLKNSTICNESRIVNDSFRLPGITPLTVRDALYRIGKVAIDKTDEAMYLGIVKGGLFKMDSVLIAIMVENEGVFVAAYMRMSLFSKKTCREVINELRDELGK
jgi:hypothetical protein